MINRNLLKELAIKTESKILLVVMDGLGGLTNPATGKSELETANIPNLDKLARESFCGLTVPINYGITPGSGPAHLSLFGYNPLEFDIGRGVLEALGIGLKLGKNDLAARANFATMDNKTGLVTDRRAGRIPTEKNVEITTILQQKIKKIDDVEVIIRSGKGHRFVVVFSGPGLEEGLTENDPQKENQLPHEITATRPESKKSAEIINKFLKQVREIIGDMSPANYALMRGFAKYPHIPSMEQIYKLTPAAIATYPMYRGLAQLVGMDILTTGESIDDEINTLQQNYDKYDFFYLHIKPTDALGEDGNFEGKIKKLEEIDKYIPNIVQFNSDVLMIAGDHSTPAMLKGHSWHPVPFMLYNKYAPKNDVERFTERACKSGSLGIFPAQDAILLALANAGKLAKYGA